MQDELSLYRKLQSEDPAQSRYFQFEEDFVEENIRCIPMIVRFKMDAAGIKLKLYEWSRFTVDERMELAEKPCGNAEETAQYREFLVELVKKHTGRYPSTLAVDLDPQWAKPVVPEILQQKAREWGASVNNNQWKKLSSLQRFALLKLCRPGHDNKNFSKAMKEFRLM